MGALHIVFTEYLEWMQAGGAARSTLKTRLSHLNQFALVVDPYEATSAEIITYLASKNWKPETRRAARSSLKSFYQWAELTGWRDDNPTVGLRSIRVPDAAPKPTPEAVLARALKDADDTVALALLLGAYAGLRLSEIAKLHADGVEINRIRVKGKGGKVRLVPLHPALREALEVRLMDYRGYLFPSPKLKDKPIHVSWIHVRVKKALGGYTTHTLRHRFATSAYQGSHDIRAVQRLLGHSNVNTTQRYVEVGDDSLIAAVLSVA